MKEYTKEQLLSFAKHYNDKAIVSIEKQFEEWSKNNKHE